MTAQYRKIPKLKTTGLCGIQEYWLKKRKPLLGCMK